MRILILGMLMLIGIHLLPAWVTLRRVLVRRLGERVYQGIFALIALGGLVLIIRGMGAAEFVAVWQPPAWGRHLSLALMLPAVILLVGAYLPGNVKRLTPHPMLWGVLLWSIAHLLANGDRAALILFGGLGGYAVFAMLSANRRGARKQASRLPFARDLLVLGLGLTTYLGLIYLHPLLFGVKVISI